MDKRPSKVDVAILCGDPIVARIIGNLLRAVGYKARPAEEIPPGEVPGVALLLIASGAASEEKATLFEAAGVPTLDLAGSSSPCRIEDISAAVENALSSGKVAEPG